MQRKASKHPKGLIGMLGWMVMLGMTLGCAATKTDLVKIPPQAPAEVPLTPAAPRLQPGSLWPGESVQNTIFADYKARRVNDIVTIVVQETSGGTSKASTNTSRDATTTAGIATLLGLEKSLMNMNENLRPKIEVGGSASNSLKGQGDTNRGTTLSARLTARVVKVLDNGNLMIEGRRQLTLNAEDQNIVISGIVRPTDITTDNLIYSQFISDAKIYYTGHGVINEKMQPGWLTRIVDRVWPF